jgi:hypothetical protein
MIAIAKIKIDKSKIKINIDDFLNMSICMIKKKIEFEKVIEQIEYEYYIRMIHSLKLNQILKRCLAKDATASFIQNLIRLLGPKNNEALEIANLNSRFY